MHYGERGGWQRMVCPGVAAGWASQLNSCHLVVTSSQVRGHHNGTQGPCLKQVKYQDELLAVPLSVVSDFLAVFQLISPLLLTLQLIRVCAQQRDATSALAIYDWMRAPKATGGGGLQPTVFTYSEMLRATLAARLLDRGMQVRGMGHTRKSGQASIAGVPEQR